MNTVIAYIVAAAALAQPWRAPEPQAPGQAQAQTPKFRAAAVYCSNGAGGVPESLENLKPLLEKLPYDTFEEVARRDFDTPPGQETKVPLNGIYTLFLTAGAAQPQQQALPIEARVEMLEGDGFIDALRAQGKAAPQQALLFRGLPMDAGELAIVLMLLPPDNGDGQSQQQKQDQQEQQQQQEQEQEEKQEQQEQQQEQQQQQAQAQQEEAEEEEQKDLQNVEAILQSLEEQDRREQHDAHNERRDVQMRGGWW